MVFKIFTQGYCALPVVQILPGLVASIFNFGWSIKRWVIVDAIDKLEYLMQYLTVEK